MGIRLPLIADTQPTELVQPRQRLLCYPPKG